MKSDYCHFSLDIPTDFLLATDWTFQALNPGAGRSFSLLHSHPQQPWGPPGHLYNEYWGYFPGVKGLGRGVDQPHLSSAAIENDYSYTSTPLVMGQPLLYPTTYAVKIQHYKTPASCVLPLG